MGFLLMFDLTNEHSLTSTRDWLDQLVSHIMKLQQQQDKVINKAEMRQM